MPNEKREKQSNPRDAQEPREGDRGRNAEVKREETGADTDAAPEENDWQRVGESNARHEMEGGDPRVGRGGEPKGPPIDEVGEDKDIGDGAVNGRV